MDGLIAGGIQWILAIQGLGAWLEAPMKLFSFLGTENFFLLVLPLIYWCVDAQLGIRVGFILITSSYVNGIFKLWFAGPRPYWVSDKVIPFSAESSFGVPSGHAQNAVTNWGMLAAGYGKRWAWGVAVALMFFIGFSRWYLGVHFPHDVLLGWLIGGLLLWGFLRYWDALAAWLSVQSIGKQVLSALLVSLVFVAVGAVSVGRLDGYVFPEAWRANALRIADRLPEPVSMEDSLTSAGLFFGLALGLAWIKSRGGYQVSGPVLRRALCFFIGVVGVLILWRGLGLVFPHQEDVISYALRYIRYTLVGAWVSGGAPWLFFRFKLANSQM